MAFNHFNFYYVTEVKSKISECKDQRSNRSRILKQDETIKKRGWFNTKQVCALWLCSRTIMQDKLLLNKWKDLETDLA